MALSTQPYKGARDFYPEDKRQQKYIFGKLREVVERFGYEEYDAPVMEPVELYLAKTGEEIVNEQTYTFEDRGGRKVALRPEMTPTVSRLVAAKRNELSYPLRMFNIGPRWRYERQQRGRQREFFQLDVDLFGVATTAGDSELVHVADSIMRSFGAQRGMYSIRLNGRAFIDHVLSKYLHLDEVQSYSISKLIDRMHKMEQADFLSRVDALCTPSQRDAGLVNRLTAVLNVKSLAKLPDELKGHQSLANLRQVMAELSDSGITNAEFDPTLMRGFDYYTGVVFELFDTSPENNRSLFGGGRYDGLVGLFGVDPVPTVGFAMGDATLQNFLKTHDLLPDLRPETRLYIALVGNVVVDATKIAAQLRAEGVNVAVDIGGRSLDKQLKTADKKGVPFALVIGENELSSGLFAIKNMHTGESETHSIDRIASIVNDARTHFDD